MLSCAQVSLFPVCVSFVSSAQMGLGSSAQMSPLPRCFARVPAGRYTLWLFNVAMENRHF